MTDSAFFGTPTNTLATGARLRPVYVLLTAFGLIALAAFNFETFVGAALLVSGAALAAMSAISIWSTRRSQDVAVKSFQAAALVAARDPSPCFITDLSGEIKDRNPVAEKAYPAVSKTLVNLVSGAVASPSSTLEAMRSQARQTGVATSDLRLLTMALRLTAHLLDKAGYLWRVEAVEVAVAETQHPDLGLASMLVDAGGKIVELSPTMEAFLGGHPPTLDRIVTRLPIIPGVPVEVETASGRQDAVFGILEGDAGQQQVFLWPGQPIAPEAANLDTLPVPMMRLSPEGRVLAANARARRLLRIDNIQSVDFAEVITGLGRPVNDWLMDVAEGRGPGRSEVVRAARPEQEVFLQVSLGRVSERGEISVLAVLIDATELKSLEAQIVQSQKMQAIGQLAGGVAHDFNNLLTAISGHCDLLLLRHKPDDPDYSDLTQIGQNANRAAYLVGQLLAFSRKQNLQPELLDLRDIFSDLTHLLNRLVGEKIDLGWRHDPHLPRVRADKRQLEQVVMNLVLNARDAMPDGGAIEIETRSERLDVPLLRERAEIPLGDYVIVSVKDQGCGIPQAKLGKIFEPFFSTKRQGEGTGLGLSMAYGIVKQSGGFIFADSAENEGTEFTIYFPAHKFVPNSSAGGLHLRMLGDKRPDGGAILLVEDEAPVRAFASRALKVRGFSVVEADCAETALQILGESDQHFDLFVTDVVMPGLDGPTWVAKALRTRPDVRVIFVSGYAEDSFGLARSKIPNSVFLPKPFSLSQLTEVVQTQLG